VSGKAPEGYRELAFADYGELLAELDRLESAHRSGVVRALGNWSAGQIFQHVGKFIRFTFDGFPMKPPWFVAAAGRLMKPFLGMMKLRPGLKLPKGAEPLLPDDGVSFEDGLAELRAQIARIEAGERMEKPSPLFGRLGHERWKTMHLDHAAMHLGFLVPHEAQAESA